MLRVGVVEINGLEFCEWTCSQKKSKNLFE